VAKDSKRKAAVVVTGRTARTVRLGANFARVRLGRRVGVTAARRADGTYAARGVRVAGRASRARFAAVVVRHDRAARRMILSAGGSVASGLLQPRTGVPVTVRRPNGSMFSCNAPADLDLSYFTTGEHASLTCRVDGGVNTLLKIRSERYEVGADGSVSVYLHGTLDAKTDTSVTVRAGDGHTVMCTVPSGTNLAAFGVGTSVKMHCHKLGGQFRLEYLKSDSAVIEVGH
jgi:hypothetical protein